ncbi:MarR family winged helix-turn-helix transcriptional regulator [Flexithrix dorotheae]|uniref:MarR family winged helix-turn-helix transcriptional regulator n=1 Tax=Flexithrix dorotheae TaxID=70993 RepID=UPI00036C53B7|nr:MarR family winged helix-turn-helix transcriptional regulator [Flexithrix dorotheae]
MKESVFNPEQQLGNLDSKIIVALERISEAFRVNLWNESKDTGLSPIQIQLLIFMAFHGQDKCKVTYLAKEFNMTKATISDAVKILDKKALIDKSTDPEDSRSYTIQLTAQGREVAKKSALFANGFSKALSGNSPKQKTDFLVQLLQFIDQLHRSGVIQIQRMCFSCGHYRQKEGHYCELLNKPLLSFELRVDCPEHQEKSKR